VINCWSSQEYAAQTIFQKCDIAAEPEEQTIHPAFLILYTLVAVSKNISTLSTLLFVDHPSQLGLETDNQSSTSHSHRPGGERTHTAKGGEALV